MSKPIRLLAPTLALAIFTTACTSGSEPAVGRVEVIDPQTGEAVLRDLVEAEASGHQVRSAPDTQHEWPSGYLTATGTNEADLDAWAQQACNNLTTLPDDPTAVAVVAAAGEYPPSTTEWGRHRLVETFINRWCPDYITHITQAIEAMTQPADEAEADSGQQPSSPDLGPATDLPDQNNMSEGATSSDDGGPNPPDTDHDHEHTEQSPNSQPDA